MKRVVALLAGALLFGQANALFINGGFEDGNFNGWTITYGTYGGLTADPYYGVDKGLVWGASNPTGIATVTPGAHVLSDQPSAKVINNTFTVPGQVIDVNPYVGDKMAVLNDIYGYFHATKVTQSDLLSQQDIANGSQLYVDWGAMLVDPRHSKGDQPFFQASVKVNGVAIQSFSADATVAATPGSGWIDAGNDPYSTYTQLYYKADQWVFDLTKYSVGDQITIDLVVADCGQGGHGAYAFLDGIGTIKPPMPTPEPSTISMFVVGLGMLGLFIRRKKS